MKIHTNKKPDVFKWDFPKKYTDYYRRSKKKGLEFDLSVDQFNSLINDKCHYCGKPGSTIDRIDSKIGYVELNVVPSCIKCNMMKYTYLQEEFLNHIKDIYNFQVSKDN